jgi:hypothetical protein
MFNCLGLLSYLLSLDRHEQEMIAKTYAHEVLGMALARGWKAR